MSISLIVSMHKGYITLHEGHEGVSRNWWVVSCHNMWRLTSTVERHIGILLAHWLCVSCLQTGAVCSHHLTTAYGCVDTWHVTRGTVADSELPAMPMLPFPRNSVTLHFSRDLTNEIRVSYGLMLIVCWSTCTLQLPPTTSFECLHTSNVIMASW